MLGYSLFKNLSVYSQFDVYGTVRSIDGLASYFKGFEKKLFKNVDVLSLSIVEEILQTIKPTIVINCIGLIKQQSSSNSAIDAITINSLLPHQLALICDKHAAKLIHFSTDCVFNGTKGGYIETDNTDALDLYGRSKQMGEVTYAPHLTFRTSIIGHELNSSISLVDWFLSQSTSVSGYSKAIFSGMPTCYIAKIFIERLNDIFTISGLYHLSVTPIDKFTLLNKISSAYKKDIIIDRSETLAIDRSLSKSKLDEAIGFTPPNWNELVNLMYADYQENYIK